MDAATTVEDVGMALIEVAGEDHGPDGLALLAAGLLPHTPDAVEKIACIAQRVTRANWWETASADEIRAIVDCGLSDHELLEHAMSRTLHWQDEALDAAHRAVMIDRGYVS